MNSLTVISYEIIITPNNRKSILFTINTYFSYPFIISDIAIFEIAHIK